MKASIKIIIALTLFFSVTAVFAQDKPDRKLPAKAQAQQENQQRAEEASHGAEVSDLSKTTVNGQGKGNVIRSAARKGSLRGNSTAKEVGNNNQSGEVEGRGEVVSDVVKSIVRPDGVGRPSGVAPSLPGVVPPAVPVPPVIRPGTPPGGRPVVPPVTPPNGLPIGLP